MTQYNLRVKLRSIAGELKNAERLNNLICEVRLLSTYSGPNQLEMLRSEHVSPETRQAVLKHGIAGAERVWEHETKLLIRRLRRKA